MTRSKLNRTLGRTYWVLSLVLAISLLAKLADHIPGIAGSPFDKLAKDVYEYMKDMALIFITVVAAYLANVFQRRQQFITALKEEWRELIRAKSALYAYTQLDEPTVEQYLAAFCAISETIDNMRTVYENVGETAEQIGLYPFAPLHDMRRAFQTLEPRKNGAASAEGRKLARDAILQSFYAMREGFLGELDLEAPDQPILTWGARRLKKPGVSKGIEAWQDAQKQHIDRIATPDLRIQTFLKDLYDREQTTPKAWRQVTNGEARPAEPSAPLT